MSDSDCKDLELPSLHRSNCVPTLLIGHRKFNWLSWFSAGRHWQHPGISLLQAYRYATGSEDPLLMGSPTVVSRAIISYIYFHMQYITIWNEKLSPFPYHHLNRKKNILTFRDCFLFTCMKSSLIDSSTFTHHLINFSNSLTIFAICHVLKKWKSAKTIWRL